MHTTSEDFIRKCECKIPYKPFNIDSLLKGYYFGYIWLHKNILLKFTSPVPFYFIMCTLKNVKVCVGLTSEHKSAQRFLLLLIGSGY